MAKQDIDSKRLHISVPPPRHSTIQHLDDVYIVITQAYCPNGHNLIDDANESFDGYPGIKLYLESSGGNGGNVVLSPFHGDHSKKGKTDWSDGTPVTISCPECSTALPKLANCRCPGSGDLVKVFLTPQLNDSHVLAVCNIWGCKRSRTIDNWQIISEYLDGQIEG